MGGGSHIVVAICGVLRRKVERKENTELALRNQIMRVFLKNDFA